MTVIRDPFSSLPFALIVPQETARTQEPGGQQQPQPGVPKVEDRGAAPTTTGNPQDSGTEQPTGPDAQKPQPSCAEGLMGNLPLLLGFVAIFYFLIIRPGQKQEKARKAMLSALKKGDAVVTNSGIHGEVTAMTDTTVTIRVDQDVQLTFDRAAIARVARDDKAGEAGAAGS